MSEECSHDCSNCSQNCGGAQDLKEKLNEFSSVGKVIGVVSGKGGVGKTLVTSMLATLAARAGKHAAVLDADITGPSVPKVFGLHGQASGTENFIIPARTEALGIDVMSINLLLDAEDSPVVWRGPVIAGAVKQFWTDVIWNDVDYMFVDMPPGTGDVPLTVFQSIPVDGIVIVTSPQELVSMIVSKAVKMAEMMHIPVLGVVENMSYLTCPDCGRKIPVFGESHLAEVAESHGLSVLGRIPMDPALAAACDAGTSESFSGDYLDDAATKIRAL